MLNQAASCINIMQCAIRSLSFQEACNHGKLKNESLFHSYAWLYSLYKTEENFNTLKGRKYEATSLSSGNINSNHITFHTLQPNCTSLLLMMRSSSSDRIAAIKPTHLPPAGCMATTHLPSVSLDTDRIYF